MKPDYKISLGHHPCKTVMLFVHQIDLVLDLSEGIFALLI